MNKNVEINFCYISDVQRKRAWRKDRGGAYSDRAKGRGLTLIERRGRACSERRAGPGSEKKEGLRFALESAVAGSEREKGTGLTLKK